MHDRLQQSLGAQQVDKQNIQNLTEQLRLSRVNISSTFGSFDASSVASRAIQPATHPDLDKFNENKAKLDQFVAHLNLKFLRKADHFVNEHQDINRNIMAYAISPLEGDVFPQIEPYITADSIDLFDVASLVDIFNMRFGEVNLQLNMSCTVFINSIKKISRVFSTLFSVCLRNLKSMTHRLSIFCTRNWTMNSKNLFIIMKKETPLLGSKSFTNNLSFVAIVPTIAVKPPSSPRPKDVPLRFLFPVPLAPFWSPSCLPLLPARMLAPWTYLAEIEKARSAQKWRLISQRIQSLLKLWTAWWHCYSSQRPRPSGRETSCRGYPPSYQQCDDTVQEKIRPWAKSTSGISSRELENISRC